MCDKKYRHSVYTAILVYLGISYIHAHSFNTWLVSQQIIYKNNKIIAIMITTITINNCNYRVNKLYELLRSVRVFVK